MTTFSRTRWAITIATLLAIGAMLRYPGGTPRDPATSGYTFLQNFLSDLGMTVAYDGRSNRLGALLFVSSLGILIVGLGSALLAIVKLHSRHPASRRLARAAAVVGVLVCASFVGVAATPENRVMALHVQFTLFAFRAFPAGALFFALASFADPAFPRRVTVAWLVLTLVLAAYVVMLGWGPNVMTTHGLGIQVAAQKIVTVCGVLLLAYQVYEADPSPYVAARAGDCLSRHRAQTHSLPSLSNRRAHPRRMTDHLDRREFLLSTAVPLAAFAVGPRAHAAHLSARSAHLPADVIRPPSKDFLATLPRAMEIAGVPGVGMAVVQDGRMTWQNSVGVADAATRQPITAQTLWPAASLSKPVFAFAALRLVDDGKLDLDRPLKAYVPDHAPADSRGDRITARHVLTHSSGLRNWRGRPDQPLVPDFEPGTKFQYSGEGYYYLLRAVEHITGVGFEQFMQERVFGPLGMRDSTYAWRADVASRLVTGHDQGQPRPNFTVDFASRLLAFADQGGRKLAAFTSEDVAAAMGKMTPAPAILPNFMIPNAAASLITNPAEYSTFLIQLLTGGNAAAPLTAASRALMFTAHTPINAALSWGAGLGQETHEGGEHFAWHWGDNGSWKNFVLIHPASRSAIVVFTNGSRGLNVANRIMTAATGSEHEAFLWL